MSTRTRAVPAKLKTRWQKVFLALRSTADEHRIAVWRQAAGGPRLPDRILQATGMSLPQRGVEKLPQSLPLSPPGRCPKNRLDC